MISTLKDQRWIAPRRRRAIPLTWLVNQPAAVAAALAWASVAPVQAQEANDLSVMRTEALDLTNAARAEAALPPLSSSNILDQAAQGHATDMLERDYYDHVPPEGETPFDRFLAAGGNNWAVSGENIATCEGCPVPPNSEQVQAFHDGWMQSPEHRENILSEGFDSFGFAMAAEVSTIYAVQTFSGPGIDGTEEGEAALDPEAARDVALSEINAARRAADLEPLAHSEALDAVAERVLDRHADDQRTLPKNIFGLLPEGETGWTSQALQTARVGGSGVAVDRDDIIAIISDWAVSAERGQVLGGTQASISVLQRQREGTVNCLRSQHSERGNSSQEARPALHQRACSTRVVACPAAREPQAGAHGPAAPFR